MKTYRVEIERTERWQVEVAAHSEADAKTRAHAIAFTRSPVHSVIRSDAICDADLPTIEDMRGIFNR